MNHTRQIATQLDLRTEQVTSTIELLDAGNTLPFIARYRKEVTGGLDEEQLRQLSALLARLRKLDERRQTVIASVESQGKLTPALHRQLLEADTLTALEDLYQPYKPKRRTRASMAREKGLQGLADLILRPDPSQFQQLFGVISALRRFKDSKSATEETYNAQRVDAALRNYRLATMKSWPDIANLLIQGRFDSTVRRIEDAMAGSEDFGDNLSQIWSQALNQEIERVTRKLSGLMLQLFFNAPGIAILGYTGWLTVRGFLSGNYLTGGFFLHAFWVIVIVMVLSFFLLQICIRLIANARRINAKAFEKLKKQIDQVEGVITNPVRSQLETVLNLADSFVSGAPKS